MKICSSIFVLLITLTGVAEGQGCIGFIQHQSGIVCVEQVKSLAPGIPVRSLSKELTARADIGFFIKYFEHNNLDEYKALFRPEDWYGLSQESYDIWKSNIQKFPITLEGLVTFRFEDKTWTSIQYVSVQNGQYARSTLLMKRIGQQWYPASLDDEEKLKTLKAVFRSIKPEFFSIAFGITEDPERTSSAQFQELQAALSKGNTIHASKVFELSKKGTASEAAQMVFYNLKERVNPEADFNRDRLHDAKLVAYMDSLGLDQVQQAAVLDLIKSFDYVKAGVRIAQYTEDPINFPPHIDAIRKIYGDDRIRNAQAN
jgi:hypothetical protein